jgi:hypothetical protein
MKGFAAGLGRFALLARTMCDAPSRPRSVRTTTPDRFKARIEAGLPAICALDRAGVKVKATGLGLVLLAIARPLEAIETAARGAQMAGTDRPSNRAS